jgi:hypothetical protein
MSYNLLWYVLGAAMAVVVLVAVFSSLFTGRRRMPYERRAEFLTPAEHVFFRVLEQAVAGNWYIFPKVRIGDLLAVTEGAEDSRTWFARIGQKHVDFVLAGREEVRPLLVIELDDSSHQRKDRIERDAFVDEALATAGLPILRVVCAQQYDAGRIGRSILERIDAN